MPRPAEYDTEAFMSLEQIGQELGITRERVRQLVERGLAKLKVELQRRGIKPEDVLPDQVGTD